MFAHALRSLVLLGLALLIATASGTASSAQEYPTRSVRIIVGFGPGGLGDIVTRAVAQKLADQMGQPFVVENMPGAGGITATATVAKAAPDGHTMLLISGQNATAPLVFKSLPFDPVADFRTVSIISNFDFIIIVAKGSPYEKLSDLIARAKAEPGKFNFGTIASGSLQNLMSHLFVARAGLTVPTVPFRTTGDLLTALMAGEVQAAVETVPAVVGQIQQGQVRALALSASERRPLFADVPTAKESGVNGYEVTSWNGFVVPARTPDAIVRRLNAEIAKAIAQPDMAKRFAELGLVAKPSTPEAMQKVYNEDLERWRSVIADAKLKLQQ